MVDDSGGDREFLEAPRTWCNWRSGAKNGDCGGGRVGKVVTSGGHWDGRMRQCWAGRRSGGRRVGKLLGKTEEFWANLGLLRFSEH